LSHLTLMVVFGLLLLTMDRRRTVVAANAPIEGQRFMETGSLETGSMVGERV
jgi:hypothetical protein